MNESSFNTEVKGGTVAFAGAQYVHIENFTQYAPPPATAPAPQAGPIPACPYPGLAYFGPQDSARFFGRERAIQSLVTAVEKRSFTALVGASGSGKSSVVLAGLAPRLDAQGGWRSAYFRIGLEADKNPFAALARALEPLTGKRSLADQLEEVQKLTAKLAEGSVSLLNVIAACRTNNPGKRILLIADQFEEAFTLVPDHALRERFINALIEAFPDPHQGSMPDVCLVLTLRADFYNAALRYRPLADRLQDHVENLGPMTRDELREAIVRPAEAVSVKFEPGLVDTILDVVEKRPGSLPLLQFALREMWGSLKTPLMTRADYDAIDGVEGALAKRAQTIFTDATSNQTDAASIALFRRLFTRLVTLGEGAEDTRRIVGREELGPDAWALAQKLAGEENRLLVMGAPVVGQETAEVAHEAIIRNWPALVEWVNRDRAFQSWLRQLKPRIEEWRSNPTDAGTLLRGGPLAVAEDWIARRGEDLNEEEKAFVATGVAQRDAERRKAKDELNREQERIEAIKAAQEKRGREQRRVRRALSVAAFAVFVSGGSVLWQYHRNRELEASLGAKDTKLADQAMALEGQGEELNNRSSQLKQQHANLLGELADLEISRGKFDAALRLSAKGLQDELMQASQPATSVSMVSLSAAISEIAWRLTFELDQKEINTAKFSPDGSRLITISQNLAYIWNVKTAAKVATLPGHFNKINSAEFSANGAKIVTASDDQTARVWDTETGNPLFTLSGRGAAMSFAAVDRDGSRIVTAAVDGIAMIWSVATCSENSDCRPTMVLQRHSGTVNYAGFDSTGSRVVTASSDRTANIWDVETGKTLAILSGHAAALNIASFNFDGSLVITGSDDGDARIWNSATGKQILILTGKEGGLGSASLAPTALAFSHRREAGWSGSGMLEQANSFRLYADMNDK